MINVKQGFQDWYHIGEFLAIKLLDIFLGHLNTF